MIGLLPTTAIFLATAPTDLRKAYDGLAVLVRQSLGQDPPTGSHQDPLLGRGGLLVMRTPAGGRDFSVATNGGCLRVLPARGTLAALGRHRPKADPSTEVVSAGGRKEINFLLDSEREFCFYGWQR